MILAGGDEAGRGCVIGPMIIGVYACTEGNEKELKKIGVRDSKELSQVQRLNLKKRIEDLGTFELRIIQAEELNELMTNFSLNEIEEHAFKEAAQKLHAKIKFEKIVYDSPDVKPERFANKLKMPRVTVIAAHKADANYPVVSAASVLAKLKREEEIERIIKLTGVDFGSGYSSDPRAIKALQENKTNKEFLNYARIHWSTFEKHTGIKPKIERKTKMQATGKLKQWM